MQDTMEVSPELRAALNRMWAQTVGRAPRYRYFGKAGGPMFFWTTERYDDDAPQHAGQYVSGIYKAVGPGSRSGKAKRWELDQATVGGHTLRKDAKARALRLYREHTQ
jgi:hypothetical protein